MVAAYAFALQAMLGAVLLSQVAGADPSPFVICVTNSNGAPDHGGTKSSLHEHCVLCSLGQGAFTEPGVAAAIALDLSYSLIRNSFAIERVAHFISPTGQYQRGPPPTA